jgi:hypothetical protein
MNLEILNSPLLKVRVKALTLFMTRVTDWSARQPPGITYNAETGAAGPVFDFWITSNTTDMAMDLIPLTGNTLLFGHTRFTNRPISEICYSAITWSGVNIPQTVTLASPQCVSGAFGSPDTSAVTWSDGQVCTTRKP